MWQGSGTKDLILSRDERRTERAPVTECRLECDHVPLGAEERCAVVGQVRGQGTGDFFRDIDLLAAGAPIVQCAFLD